MTLAMVPSLPAASMPWRTMRTGCFCSAQIRSWRSRSRAIWLAVRATDDALSWPYVAFGSSLSSLTRLPALTRRASRRLGCRGIVSLLGGAWVAAWPGRRCTMQRTPQESLPMTVAAGTKPHQIFLAGRWVESPDVLVVDNPADPSTPAGTTYTATEAQYEEAVEAAVAAFQVTRRLPAY